MSELCCEHSSIKKELETQGIATEDVFIIGGASVYRQMLPYCDLAHVTKIDYAYQADTYFPNLDELPAQKSFKVVYFIHCLS